MPAKFIGFSGDPPILSEGKHRTKQSVQPDSPENRNATDDYFSSEVAPLIEQIENSTAFFGETDHSL